MRPWIVAFSLPPNLALKSLMSVTGPMIYVSIPKSKPFAEHKMQRTRYCGGLFIRGGIRPMVLSLRKSSQLEIYKLDLDNLPSVEVAENERLVKGYRDIRAVKEKCDKVGNQRPVALA